MPSEIDSERPLDIALRYAKAGVPVFPCDPKSKKPLTKNGFKDASADERQIRSWWKKHPRAMIGAPTGHVSGFDVVDLDNKPEDGICGYEDIPDWKDRSSVIARTAGGGVHLFFAPSGQRNSAKLIGPGTDTRCEGGYVVMAGSRRQGGKPYEWLRGGPEDLGRLPPFPDDLLRRLTKGRITVDREQERIRREIRKGAEVKNLPTALKALEAECEILRRAVRGTWNPTTFECALRLGHLVGGGSLDEELVHERLFTCKDGTGDNWDKSKLKLVHDTIDRGIAAGALDPRLTDEQIAILNGNPESHEEFGRYLAEVLASKPKPEPEAQPEPVADASADKESEAQPDADTEPEASPKPKAKKPRRKPEAATDPEPQEPEPEVEPDAENAAATKPPQRRISFTAAELQQMDFPEPECVVDDYIAEACLSILGGKPKIGKSWWCLDVCIAVASGGVAMGQIECEEGDVLYAALEDNARRLKSRMQKISAQRPQWTWPERLTFCLELKRLDMGGIDQLRDWITQANNPRLIIIDIFTRVKPPKAKNETPYDLDYRAAAMLQKLASETGVAIVAVMHLRKEGSDDPFDTISGTLGTTGGADTSLVLTRSSKGTVLYARGRDIENRETAVRFEKDLCRWVIEGDAATVQLSQQRRKIVDALRGSADGAPMSLSDLAGETGMKTPNLKTLLGKMVKAEYVAKHERGQYSLGPRADDAETF